jgi:hypothetical protein
MKKPEVFALLDDWEYVMTFLPDEWRGKAKDLGALLRCRKFADAESLLRTLFIHLADGCSLRETAVRATLGGIAVSSDVALMKRLRASGEWMRWMAMGVKDNWVEKQPRFAALARHLNVRLIDGSAVQEPGSTGSTWRIHYSIKMPSLECNEVHVTNPEIGESFRRFEVHAGDLFVGDRGYAHREGISHVVSGGGDVLVRINLTSLPLEEPGGGRLDLLARLRTLSATQPGDWDVRIPLKDSVIPGRLCAIKKSKQAADRARRKAIKESRRKGHTPKPETIESTQYTFVFTTLKRDFSVAVILELYRGRWQIELAFKRLKSLIGLGHLKKKDKEAARAWIHGKLLVAFLIEALILAGERFSPWGYPICQNVPEESVSLEGDVSHVASLQCGG